MKYGCHNRTPLKTSLIVQSGHFMDGVTRVPRMVSIPDPMTKMCQYQLTQLGKFDNKCIGCTHKSCA